MKVKHNLPVLMAMNGIKSIADLSEKTEVPYHSLYDFAAYKRKYMDPELIAILCKTLQCTISDLLYLAREEEEVEVK